MSTELERLRAELDSAAKEWDAERSAALAADLNAFLSDGIPEDPADFVQALRRAVRTFNRSRMGQLCDELVKQLWKRPEPYPFDEAKAILDALRRKRYFEQMAKVADVLIQTGQNAPPIRRQYAQSLLDSGQTVAGLAILEALKVDCESLQDETELAEATGLLGRASKQVYMDASAEGGEKHQEQSLRDAVEAYAGLYNQDQEKNLWHGINTVALMCRAKRDGIEIEPAPIELESTARKILDSIENNPSPLTWDCATAAEASLALGNHEAALTWIGRYTNDKEADAFAFASTLRQLEEVWQLDGNKPPEAKILHTLRSALLKREGGGISMHSPAQEVASANEFLEDADNRQKKDPVQFEKVFGADRYKSFKWYVEGVNQARGVARIEDAVGNGHGTGFLMRGSEVHPSISDEWVVITNAHVISEDPAEHAGSPPALPPGEVQVRFEASETPDDIYEVGSIIFSSGRHELDCTIISVLTRIRDPHSFKISKHLPLADGQQRVYVIGHPKGGKLSFSLHDNILLDHENPKLHYRAPTEGGSSGSPVFNSTWRLIGLHHAGGSQMKKLNNKPGVYEANEGIWLKTILEAVAAKLGS